MNGPLPPCLQRLALSLDADSKAIRRAYARELKLIDQEHDLPGFQLLRDAYEAALAWDKYRNSEPEPLTAMPDVDPHALACASLERLAAGIARIVADGASDAAPFETEIRDRLADDELLNITARSLFEARIAHLLFSEWTVEGGYLFSAAAAVFDWAHDRRSLRQFGHAGAFLDRVITERSMFQGQEAGELARQRQVMALLREPVPPATSMVAQHLATAERLLTRFPNLMAVMVSRESVEQWRALVPNPPLGSGKPPPDVVAETDTSVFNGKWLFWLLLMGVVHVFRNCSGSSAPPAAPFVDAPFEYPSLAPAAPQLVPGVAVPSASSQTDLSLWVSINNDIQYYPATPPPRKLVVVFVVLASPDGSIFGVNRLERSLDPAFDKAVEEAIMRARHVPVQLGASVRMEFSR